VDNTPGDKLGVWRDILETLVNYGSFKIIEMALFDIPYTTFYWSAVVSVALFCTVFELFDVE